MGMTLYLFDARKRLREAVTNDIIEVVHSEGKYTASAELRGLHEVQNGGFFGFKCVDGRFRLFLTTYTDVSDETGVWTLTGTDAAVAELEGIIKEQTIALQNRSVLDAARDVIKDTGWTLGESTGTGEVVAQNAYYKNAWKILTTIAQNGRVRVDPYYVFDGANITARRIDVTPRVYPYRGLIHTRKKGATNIVITVDGAPKYRVYPLGKNNAASDPPTQVTIADAVWRMSDGKPTDKPEGQTWVGLPTASASDPAYVFESRQQDDPSKLLQEAWDDLQRKAMPRVRGMATIGEMEFMPGYGHRIVRLYDRAVVRTAEGYTAESVIVGIERYYKNRKNTKIKLGDEDEADITLENQIANASNTAQQGLNSAGGAMAGVEENRKFILDNYDLIMLRATKAEVLELAGKTETRFTELSFEIDTAKEQIELKANQSVVDNLGNTVKSMSATLTVHAEQISSRVEKNGVISAINQTAESFKIDAQRIELNGYVTTNMLASGSIQVNIQQSNVIATNTLEANTAQIGLMIFNDYYCQWKSKTFVTGVTFPSPLFRTIEYMKPDGSTGSLMYVAGWADQGDVDDETFWYMHRGQEVKT